MDTNEQCSSRQLCKRPFNSSGHPNDHSPPRKRQCSSHAFTSARHESRGAIHIGSPSSLNLPPNSATSISVPASSNPTSMSNQQLKRKRIEGKSHSKKAKMFSNPSKLPFSDEGHLYDLAGHPPQVQLMVLHKRRYEFKGFLKSLKECNVEGIKVVLIVRILCHLLSSDGQHLQKCEKFVYEELTADSGKELLHALHNIFCQMPTEKYSQRNSWFLDLLKDTRHLFEVLLNKWPNFSQHLPIDALHGAANQLASQAVRYGEVNQLSQLLVEKRNCIRTEFYNASSCSQQVAETECNNILPTPKELRQQTLPLTLVKNQVKGCYSSTAAYLECHYNLLREDFIHPLRCTLHQFQSPEGDENCHEVKVYDNVRFNQGITSLPVEGTVFRISFEFPGQKGVKWERSKRFTYGSLVCLFRDDFEKVIFGTVAERKVEDLKQGILTIKLQTDTDVYSFSPELIFKMIVSPAYYGAYYPVLKRLEQMKTPDTPQSEVVLPFSRYLVECSSDILPPAYMQGQNKVMNLEGIVCEYHSPAMEEGLLGHPDHYKVDIFDLNAWSVLQTPSLDCSQKAALHAALTKELAIIQGPPGTGKTYIGLKIVEALLNNTHQSGKKGPIVVVCYTNHALDQFLEGILTINNRHKPIKIQRIGGRCKSEKIQEYSIQKTVTRVCRERMIYGCSPSKVCKLQSKVQAIEQLLWGKFVPYNFKVYCSIFSKNTIVDLHYCTGKFECHPSLNALIRREGDILAEWLSPEFKREIEEFKIDEGSGHGTVYDYHKYMEDDRCIAGYGEDDDDTFLHKALKEQTIKKFIMQLKQADGSILAPKEYYTIDLSDEVPLHLRLELFKGWLLILKTELQQYLKEKEQKQRDYVRMRDLFQVQILKEADVIGMTTTGAAMYSSIMSQIEARTIIVEEAAEVLEAHVLTTLTQHTQHLVLIGDHEQLRPKTTDYFLARDYHLDISLFERLVNNRFPSVTLEIQHRMRPQISKLVSSCIYSGRLKDHASTLEYEDIRGMSYNMYFVDHREPENYESELKSPANHHEAVFLAHLCLYLLQQGYKPEEITVITPYMGQVFRLQDAFKDKRIFDVRITPIDSYQGEENEIILLSLVRSNEENKLGFVKESNRVCVALSRAKCGFYCIGNFHLLTADKRLKLWCSIVHDLQDRHLIETSLPLQCSSHGTITNVSSESDFDKVADGGCDKNCGARLPCNHICPRKCHPNVDEVHQEPCKKPCPKYCKTQQHRCKNKCYEECGDCKEPVEKIIPKCGHTQQVPCHQDPNKFVCKRNCQKTLQCGHSCTKKCGQLCVRECQILVTREWPCGHTSQAECYVTKENHSLLRKCKAKCDETLECGHKCTGTCGTCYQGRLHKRCSEKCERPLLCGHLCSDKCAQNCPPCPKKCIFTCSHGSCGNECSTLCKPCPEKCEWKCEHHECTKNCGEICNRPRCNKPCRIFVNIPHCLHRCQGLCGEQCPVDREGKHICKICDEVKWNELCQEIFGTEEEPGARFIQLVDCGHIFEVTGLDRWMDMDPSGEGAIQWKTCLICKQPIINTLRYSNIAKQTLTDINKAKKLQCFSMSRDERKKLEEDIDRMAHQHMGMFFRNCEERVTRYKKQIRELPDSSLKQDHVILCAASDAQKACQLVSTIQSNCAQTEHYSDLKKKVALLLKLKDSFNEFLKISWHQVTNQIQSDVHAERRRLLLLANTYKLLCDASATQTPIDPNDLSYLQCIRERCETVGHKIEKLDDEGEYQSMQSYLQDLSKKYGAILTKEERKMIIVALHAKPGSWYKCPKGHIYQIGECGGAMQEGRCPECGATIGGSHHRLRDDNTHAGEFDSSAHAAWSEGANLANYDLQDIV